MKHIFFLLWMTIICISAFSQGLRNEQYKYSETDIEYLLKYNNIVPFKFLFKSDEGSSLNVIVKYYRNGKLVKEYNLFDAGAKFLIKHSDEPRTHYLPKQNAEKPPFYKFYVHNPKNDNSLININVGTLSTDFKLDSSAVKLTNVLALYDEQRPITKLTPILLVYGWNNPYISCPTNESNLEAIIKEYEIVAIVYVEPFDVDKAPLD